MNVAFGHHSGPDRVDGSISHDSSRRQSSGTIDSVSLRHQAHRESDIDGMGCAQQDAPIDEAQNMPYHSVLPWPFRTLSKPWSDATGQQPATMCLSMFRSAPCHISATVSGSSRADLLGSRITSWIHS